MLDKNGREIQTGDIVQVSGSYFKTGNGLFYVSNLDTERRLWLHRIKKNGELCVSSASSTQNWPLTSYCSDARKNREAKIHNAEHAQIEVMDGVNTWHVAEHFRQMAREYIDRAESWTRRCEPGRAEECEQSAKVYAAVADRLSETAQKPKEKEPEIGIKFYWNGIKVDGGRLIPCYYWLGENSVAIHAREYSGDLPRQYFKVENNSDPYTDYFDTDSAELTPEHPLYKFARYAALKSIVNGKTYRKPTPEHEAEWSAMKDPGHPTRADLDAVEEMKLAEENARKAKEEAEVLERREKMLRQRSEGRHFIEQTASSHPITEGQPVVTICWSEHPAFYAWEENELKLSVAAAEIILKRFDEQRAAEERGYDKTKFLIEYTDPETGEARTYEGRYDLGDDDGGMIEHIRAFGRWYRLHDEHTGRELENPDPELSPIERFADWLETFAEGGRVVSVDFDTNVLDFVAEKRKREQAQKEQEVEMLFAQVAMLTDEQLEAAVMCVDPNDTEHLDVARFFLQELNRRSTKRAFDVFQRWKDASNA